MENGGRGLSRPREACVQGCSNGKNKECLFMEHFGRQWAGSQAVELRLCRAIGRPIGEKARYWGCRKLRQAWPMSQAGLQ